MRRRTFDLMASVGGLLLAIVLLIVGVLFQQNANFAKDNVRDQLRAQHVFFPPESALSAAEKAQPEVVDNAGKQVVDGDRAEVYADHYIAVHLKAVAGGKTYSEVSNLARENPDNPKYDAQAQTLFRGETLRGILLTSYAFWTLGEKAQELAVVFFVGSLLFLILAILGFLHYRRTPAHVEI